MIELTIFASTFAAVFFLGVQSLNVNRGHYLAAFITSLGIGVSHLVLYKTVPDADTLQMSAYLLGGPFGIISAMWAHPRMLGRPRHGGDMAKPVIGQKGPGAPTEEVESQIAAVMEVYRRAGQAHRDANVNCGADRP